MTLFVDLVSAWRARNARERVLLGFLGVLLGALLIGYGGALPLQRAANAASLHRTQASAKLAEVELAARMDSEAQGAAPVRAGGLEEAIRASAMASGIAIEGTRSDNAREITVFAEDINSAAFFAWVGVLQKAHGILTVNMTATRHDDGLLKVEARFAGGEE